MIEQGQKLICRNYYFPFVVGRRKEKPMARIYRVDPGDPMDFREQPQFQFFTEPKPGKQGGCQPGDLVVIQFISLVTGFQLQPVFRNDRRRFALAGAVGFDEFLAIGDVSEQKKWHEKK